MKHDTCINLFRTFGNLYKYPIKSLFTVSARSSYDKEIIEAAHDLHANIIFFPISICKITFPHGWAKNVVDRLFINSSCTVCVLFDRGFGKENHNRDPLNKLVQQHNHTSDNFNKSNQQNHTGNNINPSQEKTESIDPKHLKPRIICIIEGSKNDLETILFLEYLVIADFFTVEIIVTKNLIDEIQNVLDRILDFNCKITKDERAILNILQSLECCNSDLIVLGFDLYITDNPTSGMDFNVKNWLDLICEASFMVVRDCKELAKYE